MADTLDPVVHKHSIHLADIVPDAVRVGKVDDQVIAAYRPVALIENFYCRRIVAGDMFDIIPRENVSFQQDVVRADDITRPPCWCR